MIPHSIVEKTGKGMVQDIQISLTQWLSCLRSLFHQLSLPFTDMCGRNCIYRLLSEVRENMHLYTVFFSVDGRRFHTFPGVFHVNFHQRFHGHVRLALLPFKKRAFPLLCISLELEATFLFLAACSGVVLVIEFAEPCFCCFIIICWHNSSSFHSGRGRHRNEGKISQ